MARPRNNQQQQTYTGEPVQGEEQNDEQEANEVEHAPGERPGDAFTGNPMEASGEVHGLEPAQDRESNESEDEQPVVATRYRVLPGSPLVVQYGMNRIHLRERGIISSACTDIKVLEQQGVLLEPLPG